jgi:hypothetical protein
MGVGAKFEFAVSSEEDQQCVLGPASTLSELHRPDDIRKMYKRESVHMFSYASSSPLETFADTLHLGQAMMTPPITLARPAPVCTSQ